MTVFRTAVFPSLCLALTLALKGAYAGSNSELAWHVLDHRSGGVRFFGLDELQVVQGHGWGKSEGRNTVSMWISTQCIVPGTAPRAGKWHASVRCPAGRCTHTMPPGQSAWRRLSSVCEACGGPAVACGEGQGAHRG